MDRLLDEGGSGPPDDAPKLPVLFHLLDISRPRPKTPAAEPLDLRAPSAIALQSAVAAPPAGLEPELSLAPLPPLPASSLTFPALDEPLATSSPLALELAAQPPEESPPAAIETPAVTPPAVTPSAENKLQRPVTLPPARQHRFGAKIKVADDWFAAHGKFIAVAFVLALIGTVYFAQTTRRTAPRQEETVRPVAPLIELASAAQPPAPETKTANVTAPPLAPAQASAPPSSGATVELHMPTSPASPVATSPASPVKNDNLFVFPAAKPQDERVAARPEMASGPAPAPAQPQAASPAAATMPPSYPVTTAPQFTTSAPPVSYPQTNVATPVAAASPPTAYQPVTSPSAPPLPTAPPSATYGGGLPYQSPENVARGPRYERTGSGNY